MLQKSLFSLLLKQFLPLSLFHNDTHSTDRSNGHFQENLGSLVVLFLSIMKRTFWDKLVGGKGVPRSHVGHLLEKIVQDFHRPNPFKSPNQQCKITNTKGNSKHSPQPAKIIHWHHPFFLIHQLIPKIKEHWIPLNLVL